ncbi:MAG: hypothetical protein AB1749_09775 [Pseudomonadota bacterium]
MSNSSEIAPDFSSLESWSTMTFLDSQDAHAQEIALRLRDLAIFTDDEFLSVSIDAKGIPEVARKVREKLHEHLRAFAESYTVAYDFVDAGDLSSAKRTLLNLAHRSSSLLIRYKCINETRQLESDDEPTKA